MKIKFGFTVHCFYKFLKPMAIELKPGLDWHTWKFTSELKQFWIDGSIKRTLHTGCTGTDSSPFVHFNY